MSILVTILHVFVCFVLIIVILVQGGRGEGLTGAAFGSGNVQSLFGTKGSSFMTKATTAAAIGFMLTCITLDVIEVRKSRSLFESSRATAPLNVDQIKKALEKVKSESLEQKDVLVADAEQAANQAQAEAEALSVEAPQIPEEVPAIAAENPAPEA